MTTVSAAEVLRVGQREVQRLGRNGTLTVVGRAGRTLLLDPVSVRRYAASQPAAGRPWAIATTWAAVEMLGGGGGRWLDATRRGRLRTKLREIDAGEFVWSTRGRSTRQTFRAAVDQVAAVREQLVATGLSDESDRLERVFELLPDARVAQGYIRAADLPVLIARFGLRHDVGGNVVVQVVEVDAAVTVASSTVLTALDLAEADDPRVRAAGRAYLEEALAQWRG